MTRRVVPVLVLCMGLCLENGQAAVSAQQTEPAPAEIPEGAEIPEYIITQHPFPTFSNMGSGQSQSQVFSILNLDTVEHTYRFEVESDGEMAVELTKRGDLFYRGDIPAEALTLTTLAPGENQVFLLTLTAGGENPKVSLHFSQN